MRFKIIITPEPGIFYKDRHTYNVYAAPDEEDDWHVLELMIPGWGLDYMSWGAASTGIKAKERASANVRRAKDLIAIDEKRQASKIIIDS